MATSNEAMVNALSEALGSGPSSEEGLDYARNILAQYTGMPPDNEDALAGLREQRDTVVGALKQAQDRIREQTGPTRGEFLLALGQGLTAPTKTGSIGETAGTVAGLLRPIAAEQRQFEAGQDAELSKLDLALAQAEAPLSEAEFELNKLDREISGRMAQEALKTIARGSARTGRGSGALRAQKIDDLMRLYGMPESMAVAYVDGKISMELNDLGGAVLMNELTGEAFEVDAADVADFTQYLPNDDADRPNSPTRDTRETQDGQDVRLDIEKQADEIVAQRIDNGDSLWDMATVATGPWASARTGASFVSSLFGGPVATETIEARHGLKVRGRDVARAMVPNERMPVALVQMAIEDAAIEPNALVTPDMMQANLVSLDREVWDWYLDAVEDAANQKLPKDLRQQQETNARALAILLRDLRVPVDRQQRRVRILADGTVFPQASDRALTADEKKLLKPPKSFPGTQRQWDLMPLSDRELYREDY